MSGNEETIEGKVRRKGDRVMVRLERETGHLPERVWEMLTDSVYLAEWLAPGTLDARPGGRVQLDLVTVVCRSIAGSQIASPIVAWPIPGVLVIPPNGPWCGSLIPSTREPACH